MTLEGSGEGLGDGLGAPGLGYGAAGQRRWGTQALSTLDFWSLSPASLSLAVQGKLSLELQFPLGWEGGTRGH